MSQIHESHLIDRIAIMPLNYKICREQMDSLSGESILTPTKWLSITGFSPLILRILGLHLFFSVYEVLL